MLDGLRKAVKPGQRSRRGRIAFASSAEWTLERRELLATFSGSVAATANIFGAGKDFPPDPEGTNGGTLPTEFRFQAGSNLNLTFQNVKGQVSPVGDGPNGFHGADGGQEASGTTDITSIGGISGIIDPDRTMFLVGVFLTDASPNDPAPDRLSFSDSNDFQELSPRIAQTFFIGDGRTAGGTIQKFHVPEGATRISLGFADALEFGFPTSPPGYYFDNYGSLDVGLEIAKATAPVTLSGTDLKVESVRVSPTASLGGAFKVAWTARNIGDKATGGNWTDEIYLSKDQILSTDDVKLKSPISGGLVPSNGTYVAETWVKVPTDKKLTAGRYWVLVKADSTNDLVELDTENNVNLARISVTARGKRKLAALNSSPKLKAKPGLQLVVLGKWSNGPGDSSEGAGSVQNLLNVLTEKDAPSSLEFSFATRFQSLGVDLTNDSYKNAKTLIAGLAAARGSNLDLTVTVYLGYHDNLDVEAKNEQGVYKNPGLRESLKDQAKKFKDRFYDSKIDVNGTTVVVSDIPGLKFAVSPSLEDEYNFRFDSKKRKTVIDKTLTGFENAVKFLANEFGSKMSKAITFRRSSISDESLAATKTQVDGTEWKVTREFHGIVSKGTRFEVYSNDGQFVYSKWDLNDNGNQDEVEGSGTNVPPNAIDPLRGGPWAADARPDLDAFITSMNKQFPNKSKTVNLWRPAYNLFKLSAGKGSEYAYAKSTLSERTDGLGENARFNALEQQVLRKLLGIPLRG